ncbi:VapE domain-containing protein [Gloeothece verrucosa]|uniref:Virulence-associated E family protein n=1 Tax=Gloeothece verrucosa (strain PCC 7822) TaxID=497965 RepID=E0UCC0_GLOV7|nr:VapE domain-containing protein [Gloeothece verrucosa]ADN12877.1 virulence-associated E family protein [Gloeothece verrucosa PCC 7822]
MQKEHLTELEKSCIDKDIIALNFRSLQGGSPWEHLLYGLGKEERRNDGRLRDKWLQKYRHLDDGGWWCSGVDINSFVPHSLVNKCYGLDSEWGCFKPNTPRVSEGKIIKYENPPQQPTEIFALKVSEENWKKIAQRLWLEVPKEPGLLGFKCAEIDFWQWILDDPDIPLIITEGAKKTALLLSLGYPSIALPGVNSGYRNEDGIKKLISQIELLTNERDEIIFCFDQDSKFKTRQRVRDAIKTYHKLLKNKKSRVSIISWNPEDGKGVDDFVAANGEQAFHSAYKDRQSFEDWWAKNTQKALRLSYDQLFNFVETEMSEELRFDELRSQILYQDQKFQWEDNVKEWFFDQTGLIASKEDVKAIISYFSKKSGFNPLKLYLEKSHKEAERVSIDNLATRYFGTTDPLYDLMVKMWLISGVARAVKPGEQVDHVLMLQGTQGLYKSRFFRTLGDEFYDSSIDESKLNDKDTKLIVHSSWIIELAEYDRMNRRSQSEIRQWLTVLRDNFRKPYAAETKVHHRPCIFGATVNEYEFLSDRTGDRRFWVIPINAENLPNGTIDYEMLEKERDGIWASAVDAYLNREPWWPADPQLKKQINDLNEQFRTYDEWQTKIIQWLNNNYVDWITSGEILERVFNLSPDKHDRASQQRVTEVLTRLKWKPSRRGKDRIRGWSCPTIENTENTPQEVGRPESLSTEAIQEIDQNKATNPPQEVGLSETLSTSQCDQRDQRDQPLLKNEEQDDSEVLNMKVILADIDEAMTRLNWSREDGINYLKLVYGKKSRHALSDDQILEFRSYLQNLDLVKDDHLLPGDLILHKVGGFGIIQKTNPRGLFTAKWLNPGVKKQDRYLDSLYVDKSWRGKDVLTNLFNKAMED